jgi:uncharacterized OsmC-like protein
MILDGEVPPVPHQSRLSRWRSPAAWPSMSPTSWSKGRHDLKSLEARLVAQRREEPPRRFVSFTLHFALIGNVPAHAVERAIQLSRDKYCSVWHSLRQDIDLLTSFEVAPAA